MSTLTARATTRRAARTVPFVSPIASASFRALGVDVSLLVTDASAIAAATALLQDELHKLDLACSRFRSDSELTAVNARAGELVQVSATLAAAIEVALHVARLTDGAVDPLLGTSLVALGYDRDFAAVPRQSRAPVRTVRLAHWSQIELDPIAGTVRIPPGSALDLGATAKAWGADRAAALIQRMVGGGVLVNLGGDIATAGDAPAGGWSIRVQDRPGGVADEPDGPSCTISIQAGGLATSSTTVRRWQRGGSWMHHLIDPRTGMPATSPWRTVSVAAPSCLLANAASTAAFIRGTHIRTGVGALPARLVDHHGKVRTINGWPDEEK
ncbi:MAG: FAD:protein transferase [Actinomycetota bacterium]|nr:FAD:protein transferase [Actinomycetota bacterium]